MNAPRTVEAHATVTLLCALALGSTPSKSEDRAAPARTDVAPAWDLGATKNLDPAKNLGGPIPFEGPWGVVETANVSEVAARLPKGRPRRHDPGPPRLRAPDADRSPQRDGGRRRKT